MSSLSREESAELLKGLFDTKFSEPGKGWAECYITANKSYYAKFCSGSDELQCFLHGSYNDDREFLFAREESSPECMWALGEYNLDVNGGAKGFMFHYEQREHEFKPGEVLHNFNGTDYKVMECYSKNNLLMMNMAAETFLVAVGVAYYDRYPHAGEYTKDNAEAGIEWGHYLPSRPSGIDFVALRAQYCEPYEQKGNSFPIEIREVLSRVENIEAETLGDAIDKAIEMYKKSEVVLDAGDFKDIYFDIQLRQIFWYWVLGMVLGSAVSVFLQDPIHNTFRSLGEKKLGVFGIVIASMLGIVLYLNNSLYDI